MNGPSKFLRLFVEELLRFSHYSYKTRVGRRNYHGALVLITWNKIRDRDCLRQIAFKLALVYLPVPKMTTTIIHFGFQADPVAPMTACRIFSPTL